MEIVEPWAVIPQGRLYLGQEQRTPVDPLLPAIARGNEPSQV